MVDFHDTDIGTLKTAEAMRKASAVGRDEFNGLRLDVRDLGEKVAEGFEAVIRVQGEITANQAASLRTEQQLVRIADEQVKLSASIAQQRVEVGRQIDEKITAHHAAHVAPQLEHLTKSKAHQLAMIAAVATGVVTMFALAIWSGDPETATKATKALGIIAKALPGVGG